MCAAVAGGRAGDVSAYIAEAAAERVARDARPDEIERRWGPFPPEALAWARMMAGVALEPGDEAHLPDVAADPAARPPAAPA